MKHRFHQLLTAVMLAASLSAAMLFPAAAEPAPGEKVPALQASYEETEAELPVGTETEEDPDLFWVLNEETGLWYCEHPDGTPAQGWARKGDAVYFLNARGITRTGWIRSAGKWFYLYEDPEMGLGQLATDTWIDNYYVDSKGVKSKRSRDLF